MAERFHGQQGKKISPSSTVPRKNLILRALRLRSQCGYCGLPLSYEEYGPQFATKDHIQPLSVGGSDSLANLTLACLDCNRRKAGKTSWPAPSFTLADLFGSAHHHGQHENHEPETYDGW